MIGRFDNSRQALHAAKHGTRKLPLHKRLRGRIRGERPPLYGNAGLHLRLPKPYNNTVYVYIRKNGCSAFKRWMLHDMGERRGPEAHISIVARRYAVSMEWELTGTTRLLVLRDPVKRACSLYRNKFIQRKGATDIQRNFKDLTGIDGAEASFKSFVIKYLHKFCSTKSGDRAIIDPHCRTQASHLWPITYDQVIMLDDLPKVSRVIFSEEVSDLYFTHRVNSTPSTVGGNGSEVTTPASRLIERYAASGELPSDEALLDSEVRQIIQRVYKEDYDLISQSFNSPRHHPS